MNYTDSVQKINEYKYALLYNFSELKLCEISELEDKDLLECMEAHIFNEKGEIYLLPQEENAYEISDISEAGAEYVDQYYDLLGKLSSELGYEAAELQVRRYFGCDEDGQAVVRKTRLVDIIPKEV